MKKIILGMLMAVLIVPSVSFANNLSDLEAKRVDLMKQLITLLEVKVQQLQILIAERRGVDPQVLGVATSTPNVTAVVEEVKEKKRRRGGGGGSSRSSNNDQTTDDTSGETTTPEIEDEADESATSTATSTDDGLGEEDEGAGSGSGTSTDSGTGTTTDETATTTELKASLHIGESSENPDSSTIVVEDDGVTEGINIFGFTLEAKEEDVQLSQLVIRVETDGGEVESIINKVNLVIGEQTFKNKPFAEGGSKLVNPESAQFVFDLGDFDLIVGQEHKVELLIDIDGGENDFTYGQNIKASIGAEETALFVAKEGEHEIATDKFLGEVAGEVHVLMFKGIIIPVDSVETSESTSGDNDQIGTFEIEFEVTAVEGDFFIAETSSTSTDVDSGIVFSVDGDFALIYSSLTSTADEDIVGVFTVREGETETFTLRVTIDPDAVGVFRVQLDEVWYSADSDGVTNTKVYNPAPVQDFRTAFKTINN